MHVKTTSGIVVFGSIVPRLTMLPVVSSVAAVAPVAAGADRVEGFDARGRRVFSLPFADEAYTYYVFVPLATERIAQLTRITATVAKGRVVRNATRHGPPRARAVAQSGGFVDISWDARAFPRLSCTGAAGSSPAPLMLGGSFRAANIRGRSLVCDFSDGVKTAFSSVRIPIAGR